MTQRILMPIASAVALLLLTGVSQATNVVPNGTFESPANLDGWLQFPNGGTIGLAGENGPSAPGSQSAQLVADTNIAAPSFPLLKVERLAPGLLTNGAPVTVSFDARAPIQTVDSSSGDQIGNVVFFVELITEKSAGGDAQFLIQPPTFLTEDWMTYTFNTNLGPDASGGVSLQFKADCGAAANCALTALVDNVSIDTQLIPVPAAVWLFGSALGLLGWMRRKVS